jgi:hypothetical protein
MVILEIPTSFSRRERDNVGYSPVLLARLLNVGDLLYKLLPLRGEGDRCLFGFELPVFITPAFSKNL